MQPSVGPSSTATFRRAATPAAAIHQPAAWRNGARELDSSALHVALVDLYLAHRAAGEDYVACLTRIGAPGYATILRNAYCGGEEPSP